MGLNLRTRVNNVPTPEEAYAQMFGVKLQGGITNIKLCDLRPYPDQPFRLYSEDKLTELAEDIKQNGVLSPIIVRPIKDEAGYDAYQILAGHNRTNASQLAGLDEIPAIVKNVDDATAALIVVNTNLNQRDKMLPSEKAFAYKIQMESMKLKSGERTDLVPNGHKVESNNNLVPNGHKVDTLLAISEQAKESRRNIARYIRLTYLQSSLLNMVDEGTLPFRAGVELSYLSEDEQNTIYQYIKQNNVNISISQAEDIKRYSTEIDNITTTALERMFNSTKSASTASKTPKSINLNYKAVSSYLPDNPGDQSEIEEFIIKALEYYQLHHN